MRQGRSRLATPSPFGVVALLDPFGWHGMELLRQSRPDLFKTGRSNGAIPQTIFYLHPGHLGQVQESGRDQPHTTLDIVHLGAIAEMAWNQGIDLYSYANNRILAGVEYAAKANLYEYNTTLYYVPFAPYKCIN